MKYSNPRMSATIENWPSGKKRVTAVFQVEQHPKQGERAVRTTTGAPKKLTYAYKVRLVDGSDGRIYIISYVSMYEFIQVTDGTLHTYETIWPKDPQYSEVMVLFA